MTPAWWLFPSPIHTQVTQYCRDLHTCVYALSETGKINQGPLEERKPRTKHTCLSNFLGIGRSWVPEGLILWLED